MCSPSSSLRIRILTLDVLSEDAGDFRHGGLYIVARVGGEAQRTCALSDADERSWNEVFAFRLDGRPPAAAVSLAGSGGGGRGGLMPSRAPPPFSSTPIMCAVPDYGRAPPPPPRGSGGSIAMDAFAPPWLGTPYRLPTVVLELWRNSPNSDDCLAKYQFCVPLECGSDVIDRLVYLTSASSYSVQFALRVRVALTQPQSRPVGHHTFPPKMVPMEAAALWRP
ncbi:hypothetical protein DQ04_04221070 [Trypanosoma grayi]|uniref:hypothetical protein n=1 Tax=Trypanosoma grayi TaxID=71804 RepID=UPI0004F45D22|nr:hypothetical protein DQ04_04221070 [Trypanosoma grayi]KEG10075.1 hypothetical protein DQ04_04221070 [Trypanosoma grayi]